MAEIILPPEENEETPQAPELNIDKPTENSKVITIEFEAKKTNKVSTKDTNQQLYTTDTDAWFEFKETSLEGASGTYSVVFRNRYDGSIFQRTGDVVGGVAYYKIPHQEIRHAGAWRGQIVYTLSNGDTTSREFGYDVKGHILDGKDVREIVVEDFETLMSQLRSMKDNAEVELADLTQELRNTTDTAEQNETDRQAFFVDLVEDIDELQANYQELLDTGVLQTNINTKLEVLEEEYAPKLTEVTAQLAQTETELRKKANQSSLEAEKSRIDNLIALPEGSTANDARLEDIKIGTDGVVYDSPGTAVRTQFYEKADTYKTERVTNFELGYVDSNGNEIESTKKARSSIYELPVGSKIILTRPNQYLYGFNVSSSKDKVPHFSSLFYAETTYVSFPITESSRYIRFFITKTWDDDIDLEPAVNNGSIKIIYPNKVVYEDTLQEKVDYLESKIKDGSSNVETEAVKRTSDFNPTYRTPSRAEGGVITFIDDDGKSGVYDILYPLFKRKNVPFGIAIVTDWIDTMEDVMTLEQLKEIASDREIIEVMNHTKNHPSLDTEDEAFIHEQVGEAKKWFARNGFDATGLVLPYGESNKVSQNIIQQYYNACYDFGNYFPESFDNIRNQLIVRDSWDYATPDEDPLEGRKRLVDQAVAENKWLIITLHVGNSPTYWNETSESGLEELIDYIQSKGIKILSPKEGFQTFGNLIENDSGFKIQANGKIVGAK